ncbi:aminotransferase class III-fold pyridoxal phosphate-dependent enzyme [Natrinema thermotolerans]|uniref:Aminotransferase class III-fold pyridoxal phosphate-dependent enzyme n=1 Tax=Natrinema thermotolerans TaxID=121872 RepID=A0AAF0P9M2_9EURY|nr:aminotransferase class III-fold pyridoxal phosphate-dependent enzyme [Natrinema thermotolerans]ELZ08148.1 class III aminotransferase [Natrinema thermotolerans DSM 11552]QCC59532.1 aminotransferase class III-fold pyridoxal phosphate-dependent enzyme [Natrinema thermotolerans]WMT06506.1 aminotransferase class III-fold pyridoxal phosphate-dependent enzyme [Natrinema thermotolerans]
MDRDTAEPDADALPGPNAQQWVDFHQEYSAPSEYSHEFVWDVTREADGPFVTDVDGNVLLDFTCHIGAAPLGYNNEKVLEKVREFDLVEPMKIAGQDMYFGSGPSPDEAEFPGSSHLMQKLTEVSSQYGMDTVFLSNSGAEAMENAMKITNDYRAPAKYGVAFSGSFHGRTLGTLSLTKSKDVYTRHYPEISGIETVPFCADRGCDADSCDCGFFAGGGSQLRNMLAPEGGHVDPDEIAFLTLEPIQGVGGYRFPSETFMEEVAAVTDEYDIPLVVDEIQAGVGRTGEIWASDHYPIEPDVIASAKALRVGATISRSEVFPSQKNRLGSTFGGGDLLGSMMGAFTLEAIEDHDLLDNATRRGEQATELLRDDAPDHVEDVRGKGLMLAVEFDTPERRNAVVESALERGLLTLGCGKKTIRLLPPLDSTEREIELGIDIFCEAIEAVGPSATVA